MSATDATWAVARRASFGTLHYKQLYNTTFAYTETQKKVAAGTSTAVLAATNASNSQVTTIVDGITQPDVPRALSVTVGGTAASVQASSIVVSGYNLEGKPITETFITTIGTTGTINGVKAFARVTSVTVPKQVGSGVTVAVGTRNILGIRHRLFNQNTTVKVFTATAVKGALTLQNQPTVVANDRDIELNTVTPASAPDGTKMFVIAYAYDNWQADGSSVNDQPEYSTTTSTSSTSSSTSTTTITTSTSSTSSSTSSTSTSTSSTSTSTSSTSTSTTTAP